MAQRYVTVLYTDDLGRQWRVQRAYEPYAHFPGSWGFAADDATKPWKPKRLRMRTVHYKGLNVSPYFTPKTRHREVAVGNTTCAAWATRPWPWDFGQPDGTTGGYSSFAWVGEKWFQY